MDINEIASDFQMIGHSIKSLEIKNNFVHFDQSDKSINREIKVEYSLGDTFDLDDEKNYIGGTVTVYIDVTINNEENRATIHLELEGGFSLKSRDTERLKSMLEVNGCAALYSISRGIIAGITSQMSLEGSGTVLIPMINTFALKSAGNEQ